MPSSNPRIFWHHSAPPTTTTTAPLNWVKHFLGKRSSAAEHSFEFTLFRNLWFMLDDMTQLQMLRNLHHFSNAKTRKQYHFINHRTLISKECMCSNLKRLKVKDHEMQQKDRQISHSDCCSEIFLVWQRWLKEKV